MQNAANDSHRNLNIFLMFLYLDVVRLLWSLPPGEKKPKFFPVSVYKQAYIYTYTNIVVTQEFVDSFRLFVVYPLW